jgi:hypothetical protein
MIVNGIDVNNNVPPISGQGMIHTGFIYLFNLLLNLIFFYPFSTLFLI